MNNPDNLTAQGPEAAYLLERALLIIQDGITIINKEGIIVYINSAAQKGLKKQFNYSPQIGEEFLNYVAEDHIELFRQYICKAFRNEPSVYHFYNVNNNTEAWFEISLYPMPEADGTISHICLKAREVTEKVLLEKRLERQRREQKDQIVRATIDAQEKERHMLGRELHDNVNQVLTTVKLYNEICLVDESPNKEMLGKSLEQINYCISELRRISKQLSPPSIDEISLKELIRDLLQSIKAAAKINVRLYTFGIKQDKLTENIQTAIYRIAQEQLTNILRYSYASQVELFLVGTMENIALKIQDNGVGFDPHQKKKGIGITNMKNRAEALGGRFELESAPGEGCVLMVEIPLGL